MKKKINSKQKGNRAEREVAKFMSLLTGKVWNRVPCSGSLFTTGRDSEYKGDVYCNDEYYSDVVIEVKNYKDGVFLNELFNEKSNLHKWIDQLHKECDEDNYGILFFKSKGKWLWHFIHPGTQINLHYNLLKKLRNVSSYKYNFGLILKEKLKELECNS